MGRGRTAHPGKVRRRVNAAATAAARRAGLGPGDTVVVGASGGPDSCTLLYALADAGRRLGFTLHAAHLIHDFRGQESYDDADFVRRLWQPGGLTVDEVDVAAYQRERGVSSFEQAARDLRYGFLARVAREVSASTVAVGHTADDLAETALLHIARGSGLHGLRGMRETAPWPYPAENTPRLWRPLLALRRADTIAYCRAARIAYRDDSTNYMADFARNRVRLNLMPALAEQLNPQVADALARLSRTAGAALDYLEEQAVGCWPAVAPEPVGSDGMLRLNRKALSGVHPALRPLLLRRAWATVSGGSKGLTAAHLRQMTAIAAGTESGKKAMLPRGYAARTDAEWLGIGPETAGQCPYPALAGAFRLTLPWGPIALGVTKRDGWEVTCRTATIPAGATPDTGDPLQAYLSPAALSAGAWVRTWQAGDRMQPLGLAGSRKLQDIFTDARIPRGWRNRVPLVVTPRGIAWAVGVRVSDWAAAPIRGDGECAATLVSFGYPAPGPGAAAAQ